MEGGGLLGLWVLNQTSFRSVLDGGFSRRMDDPGDFAGWWLAG